MTDQTRIRLLTWAFAAYSVLSLVSMATMSIGAALLAFALLLFYPGGAPALGVKLRALCAPRSWARRYLFAALALTAACALSLLVAKVAPLTYGGKQASISFFTDMAKAWYLYWPLLLLPALHFIGPAGQSRVLRAWLVAFAALSAMGIAQHFTGWPRPQMIPGHEPFFHATLFLGHHLSVASVFIFPLFAALELSSRADGPALTKLPRWALRLAVVLGAVALILGWSRTLWVALPLGLLAWGIWALPRRWAVASTLLITLGAVLALQLPFVQKRINDGLGVGTRKELWLMNVDFLKARPLTGTGWHKNLELTGYWQAERHPGNPYVFVGHAHNNFIEMLGSTGALGALTWLGWAALAVGLALRAAKRPANFARGLACAWLVFHVNGLTQVNFWESKVLHQIALMMAWTLFWNGRAIRGESHGG